MDSLRLLIVADDPLARAGLAMLVADLADCLIVGQVSSQDLAIEIHPDLDQLSPDAILWDWGWEPVDPSPEWLDTRIPVIALVPDDEHVADAWQSGIRVVLRRDMEIEMLPHAIRAACHRLIVLDPDLVLPPLPFMNPPEVPLSAELTPRESEVLQLVAEGLTNKAMAQRLGISEHTVKFHLNAIMSKLNAHSRTEAVVRATRLGLIVL